MRKPETVTQIANYLRNRGERLRGVGLSDIAKIEKEFDVMLPKVYKEFLLSMGKEAGEYMRGSAVFYNDIFSLKEWTIELIDENNIPPLPEDAFVFWMHQGYQSAFFKVTEGDNPPIYFFSEGEKQNEFKLDEPTLIDFFYIQLLASYPDEQ